MAVCTYNGAKTIRDTLAGLGSLDYPDYEVILVDDGSTDDVATIAAEYPVNVIQTENRGLSNARNTALEASTGTIIAYIDDDAYPDPHWLQYLVNTLNNFDFAGVGGPNIAPPGDGDIADCVVNAPGGPVHVLLTDRVAEHIPGCNMAFRKDRLRSIGGFDPRFRSAGDDVDVCWRLQEQGWELGFSPAAMVWHHRRNSVRAYWKQQVGYGRAEALLEEKWPGNYNSQGHISWGGKLYGKGLMKVLSRRNRIYQGTWGSAPFQSMYAQNPGRLAWLLQMPEWHLMAPILAGLAALGILWSPLLVILPLFIAGGMATAGLAAWNARGATYTTPPRSRIHQLGRWGLTAVLYLIQPIARLCGRIRHGLVPWRRRGARKLAIPVRRQSDEWSETWRGQEQRLEEIESTLSTNGVVVRRGGDYDSWDLEARGGLLGGVRMRMAIEEHGGGRQLVRCRKWPHFGWAGPLTAGVFAILSLAAAGDGAMAAAFGLALATVLLSVRVFGDCASAMAAMLLACRAKETPPLEES